MSGIWFATPEESAPGLQVVTGAVNGVFIQRGGKTMVAQLDFMTENFRNRKRLLVALFPWDVANFGVDEQWARFTPMAARSIPASRSS